MEKEFIKCINRLYENNLKLCGGRNWRLAGRVVAEYGGILVAILMLSVAVFCVLTLKSFPFWAIWIPQMGIPLMAGLYLFATSKTIIEWRKSIPEWQHVKELLGLDKRYANELRELSENLAG